ncbi:MAG: TIGR03936 family radical SAM-associated protein [Planctomycetaceae bacterium]|nr:TIGR03936 family radical SAM-associated protein [Planctomycetaceae bacterium]
MQEQVYTWIADFKIEDRLAYLSHQETLALFERTLARARVPLSFSAGFNPRPHLSIPLPRSVGVQSGAERLCVVLAAVEAPSCDALCRQVNEQLPCGCQILASTLLAGKVVVHPAGYRLRFALSEMISSARLEDLAKALREFCAGQPVMVQRFMAKKAVIRPLDIAPFIEEAALVNLNIDVRCRVSQEGTVRVDELMQWLKLQPEHLREPVRRTEIYWHPIAA